jgi:hypothetical protein
MTAGPPETRSAADAPARAAPFADRRFLNETIMEETCRK